jgi:RNA polymerase sigma factor (sigma-70 family)
MRTFLSGQLTRLGPPGDGDPRDDQLLAKYIASRDEEAFQEIVRRHGVMVHGVCRRFLRNEADADDAFQAVFLVLIRKADSVRPGNKLGNWLYGVAVNVARKGREVLARRRTHELIGDVAQPQPNANADLRDAIDDELARLPADYRAAVVACDLEGRTRKEAASQLGWNEGTVASRLARARALLADRLARRGVMAPAAGLSAVMGVDSSVAAALPRVILAGHSELVTELAMEAMRAMSASKLQTMATIVLTAVALAGAGTGVVLACGGWVRPTVPPVSAAKPFPLQSVQTMTEGGANAWAKPMAGELAASDKPNGENGGFAKPARFVLRNPERDITIVTDRDETFTEFFRRQRVMIAMVDPKLFDAAATARQPSERQFVSSASYNESGVMSAVYGSFVRLAPLSPAVHAVVQFPAGRALVLTADLADKDVWHVAGFTNRSPEGFFTKKEKKGRDDFAPADLIHTPKK